MKHAKHKGAKTRRAMGLANMLGWFSIGLGVAELLGARPMTRALGMRGQSGTLRSYGMREIATGLGILAGRDPTPWIWGRVAGDVLDLATLAGSYDERSRKRQNLTTAMISVAGVAVLDLLCARELAKPTTNRFVERYRHRSGFRGGQLVRAQTPPDYRTPQALAPYNRTSNEPTRTFPQYDL